MYRDRGFQFLLIVVASAAALYARTAVSPLQEAMRISLALDDNELALLQGPALALPMLLASIPLGLLVDRFSRARLLLVFTACALIANVLTALAPSFALLFACRCLSGLAGTATLIAAFSMLADLYPPAQRGRANMMVLIAQFGGMAAAFGVGGALLKSLGSTPEGWRDAIAWLSSPVLPVAFLLLLSREPPRTDVVIRNPRILEALAEVARYRAQIVPLMVGLIAIETASGAMLVWGAPTLARNFVLTPDRVGFIMSVVVFAGGLGGSIAGGVLADSCHRNGGPPLTLSALSVLTLAGVPVSGLLMVATHVAWAAALLTLFMTIVSATIVAGIALFTIVIPNELRGLCLATLVGANTLFGVALAPVIVSLLAGALGGPAAIGTALALTCMTGALLSGAVLAASRDRFRR